MPPHGPGMIGTSHSHDSRFPDDSWNLYSMLDPQTTKGLNISRPNDAIGIFKPHALKLENEPIVISDADAEIIIIARFTNPVSIRKIMVIGGGDDAFHPSVLKCYVNKETIDFSNIEEMNPVQVFSLPINSQGTAEMITSLQPFTNIMTVAFYFPSNHGQVDTTMIKYIGLQGEHTHYRREAVDTVYEVLCNGQDICQPEESLGAHAHHMH